MDEDKDKDKAESEKPEKEMAEKEEAEKDKAERERAEREAAEKKTAEKEEAERKKAEERAEKERAERETAEKEKVEKEEAERQEAEKETVEEADGIDDVSDSEKKSFSFAETKWPRFQLRTLDEVRRAQAPMISIDQPTPPANLFIVEAADARLGLSLVANSQHATKFYMSIEVAENGERELRYKRDQRGLLRMLGDNVRSQHSKFAQCLLVIHPGERGRGIQFWKKLSEESCSIEAFLKEHGFAVAILSIQPSLISPENVVAVVKVDNCFPLIEALCEAKGIFEHDEHLAQAKRLCTDPEVAIRLITALGMEDDGNSFLEEVESSFHEKELRDEANKNIDKFFLTDKSGHGAAVFTASFLPEAAFSDFELIVNEIITAKAFAQKEESSAPSFNDATLSDVRLRRGRRREGERRLKTVICFEQGLRFPAIMRGRIEARATLFSSKAFQRLGERLVAGAVGIDTACRLVEQAATHIARQGDGDADLAGKQIAAWFVGIGSAENPGSDGLLLQRASTLVETTERLFLAACSGLARGLGLLQSDCATSLACGILALPEANFSDRTLLLRIKVHAGYAGLISGATPQRLIQVMQAANNAPNICKWIIGALVGNNWGLAAFSERPTQDALDCLIQAGSQILVGTPSLALAKFAERITLRAIGARIQLDMMRTFDQAPPVVDASTITSLLNLAAMEVPIGDNFRAAELDAARALEEISTDELKRLLPTQEMLTALNDVDKSRHSQFVAGEAVFSLQSALISGLIGITQGDTDSDEAFAAFLQQLQRSEARLLRNARFSTTFFWLRDFAASPSSDGLRRFTEAMNGLRRGAPVLCCALACSGREETQAEKGAASIIDFGTELDFKKITLDQKSWRLVVDRIKDAMDVTNQILGAWLDGVANLPPSKNRRRFVSEPRHRRNLLRSFFLEIREARSANASQTRGGS